MKILYDHQTFTLQEYGGVSRYYYELINRFDAIYDSCTVSTCLSNNVYLNKNTYPNLKSFFPGSESRVKMKIMNVVNKHHSIKKLQKSEFDVFHPTYYDDYFLKSIGDKPFVVTFHDMIHEKFSDQFPELQMDKYIFNQKKILIKRANKIITVSETTKRDVMDIFNVDGRNIDVVYLGNSLKNVSLGEERIVNDEYILFVGNRSVYKNFEGFISSVSDLLIDSKLILVCAGGGEFTELEIAALKSSGLKNRVLFIKITSDSILSNLYANALFFVFPSLYEGFGIPVLESFACNCPALLSNGGSLPEVGGDAAAYFNPNDHNSIYTSVHSLINNQSLRQKLKERGTNQLKKFSWDKTFSNTLKVYKSVM
jgi:glycosyltransferase involved in cell wall biosynthesis